MNKADKGTAVVIQNRSDYVDKILTLLNLSNKFKLLATNITMKRERSLQSLLRSLRADPKKPAGLGISEEVFNRVYPSGSSAGVMYGLPKIHKENAPIRTIISEIKTYNCQLAKYLDEILKPLVNDTFMLKDTYVSSIRFVTSSHPSIAFS